VGGGEGAAKILSGSFAGENTGRRRFQSSGKNPAHKSGERPRSPNAGGPRFSVQKKICRIEQESEKVSEALGVGGTQVATKGRRQGCG